MASIRSSELILSGGDLNDGINLSNLHSNIQHLYRSTLGLLIFIDAKLWLYVISKRIKYIMSSLDPSYRLRSISESRSHDKSIANGGEYSYEDDFQNLNFLYKIKNLSFMPSLM